MTTYYALPGLTIWDYNRTTIYPASNFWSLSSGGPVSNQAPTYTDDVVFDANSGSGRAIACYDTLGAYAKGGCRNLTVTSANGFSFDVINVANSVALNANCSIGQLQQQTEGGTILSLNLNTNNAPISQLYASGSAGAAFNIQSPLTVTGILNLANAALTTNHQDISVPQLYATSNTGQNWAFGTSTVTITGGSSSAPLFDFTAASGSVSGSGTIKFTGTLSAQCIGINGGSKGYGSMNFHIAVKGGQNFQISSTLTTLGTFKVTDGAKLLLTNGITITAANFVIDGSAAPVSIYSNNPGVPVNLTKSTSGPCYADRADFQYVNFTTGAGATYFGRVCTNSGGNSNITFLPLINKFLPFF